MSNNSTQPGDLGAFDASRQPQVVALPSPPKAQKRDILLRSLGVEPGRLGLDHLGMSDQTRSILRAALARPQGLVLAAGPPGSGRTTTIYAVVEHIRASRQIMPPTEDLAGELFVPEIRDSATATLAIQGAHAGCLVVSTIRAHDTAAAVQRLMSLGMSPAFLAAGVRAIVAQRLVRKVCNACRERTHVSTAFLSSRPPRRATRSTGCERCGGSGYHGRTGIFELLVIDDLLQREFPHQTGRLNQPGFGVVGASLYEDGLRQVRAGATTVAEVLRMTRS